MTSFPQTSAADSLIGAAWLRSRITEGCKNQQIYARDGYRCAYCGCDLLGSLDALMGASIDHVVPKSKGGTNDVSNLVACCTPCNRLKGPAPVFSIAEAAMVVLRRRAVLLPLLRERIAQIGFEFPRQEEAQASAPMLAAAANVLAGQVEGIRRGAEMLNRLAEAVGG